MLVAPKVLVSMMSAGFEKRRWMSQISPCSGREKRLSVVQQVFFQFEAVATDCRISFMPVGDGKGWCDEHSLRR